MTELAALNVRITGDSGDLTAAVNSAKTQLGGLNTTITQTQAKAAGMGGALGGLGNTMRGVSQQLSQVGQQTMATGNFLQALAIQLPDIGLGFGAIGTAAGLLAGIALPMVVSAFASTMGGASKLKEAMDELAASTTTAKNELFMLQTGLDTEEQVRGYRELGALVAEQTRLREEAAQSDAGTAQALIYQADAMQGQINAARAKLAEDRKIRAEIEAARQAEETRLAAAKDATAQAEEMRRIMMIVGSMDVSSPWSEAMAAARAATAEADRYAAAMARVEGVRRNQKREGAVVFDPRDPRYDPLAAEAAGMAADPNRRNLLADLAGGAAGGGGAAVNPIQSELEALQESLMTQEQLQMESYTRQQETLQQALDARLLSQKDYANLMQQVEATHQAKMGSQMREGVATTIGALSQLFNKSKPLAIASALVNTWQGMTEALKLPFPKNIAAAATTLATGMNAVRNIKSTSPGGGGSTSGSIGAGGAGGAAAAAPQQNVQTLNFTLTNDSFGIGQNLVRQIAAQLNEAQRNGSTLVRATVS